MIYIFFDNAGCFESACACFGLFPIASLIGVIAVSHVYAWGEMTPKVADKSKEMFEIK